MRLTEKQRAVLIELCRPKIMDAYAALPTNKDIARELESKEERVKHQLRVLFEKLDVDDVVVLHHNEKRARLAELAIKSGRISEHDLNPGVAEREEGEPQEPAQEEETQQSAEANSAEANSAEANSGELQTAGRGSPIAKPEVPANGSADQSSPGAGPQEGDRELAETENADRREVAAPSVEQAPDAERARRVARPRITVKGGAVVAVAALTLGVGLVILVLAGALSPGRDQTHGPNSRDPGLSIKDFAQRANEICVDTAARIPELRRRIADLVRRAAEGDQSALQALGPQLERLKEILRKRRQRMKELAAAQGEARVTVEEFVDADLSLQYGALAALTDIQDALRNRDRLEQLNVITALEQDRTASRDSARREALAQELGVTRCG